MRPTVIHLTALGLILASGAALAQQPTPDARGGRTLTTTGQTKPPGNSGSPMKTVNDGEMQRAQKAASARDKAWDTKMHTTMGSICRGC